MVKVKIKRGACPRLLLKENAAFHMELYKVGGIDEDNERYNINKTKHDSHSTYFDTAS